jgi:hypothetical protein
MYSRGRAGRLRGYRRTSPTPLLVDHCRAECQQVRIPHVMLRYLYINRVPRCLRPFMYRKMFRVESRNTDHRPEPVTNATPMRPVRNGSSPYVSCPRPHRGSRKMLIFGDQKSSPSIMSRRPARTAWLCLARASVPMATAISWINESSNVAASPIGSGKTVAVPALATPCNLQSS